MQGKNTCARTWRSKRGGGLFSGEYGTKVCDLYMEILQGRHQQGFAFLSQSTINPNLVPTKFNHRKVQQFAPDMTTTTEQLLGS